MGLGQLWDQLVNCICRPPRDDEYTVEDLVGGTAAKFSIPGHPGYTARRDDLVLTNKRGLKLQCSHYVPLNVQGRDGKLPCVIYCHCNSGSRRDCEEALFQLLPLGISVFALDFEGSGLSEGNWVTLGAHEVDDVEVVVQHLRQSGKVSTLGLWGRSMGAVTALMYSKRDPSIAGMVLDSPFSSLMDLMMEIVTEQDLPIPKALMKVALAAMKHSVKKRAGFDITEVTPLNLVPESFIPALFGHAHGDTFIKIHHSEKLFQAYAGDKNFIKVDGDHNSPRPRFFKSSVAIFFTNTLQLDHMLLGGNSEYLQYMGRVGAAAAAAQAAAACADVINTSQGVTSPRPLHPGHGGIPWQRATLPKASGNSSSSPRSPRQNRESIALPAGANSSVQQQLSLAVESGMVDTGEEDSELMLAIQASLMEQQTPSSRAQSTAGPLSPAAPPPPAVMRSSSSHRHQELLPGSREAEEDMLRRAIALSLQQSSGNSSGGTAAAAAGRPAAANGNGNYVDLLVNELGTGLAKAPGGAS